LWPPWGNHSPAGGLPLQRGAKTPVAHTLIPMHARLRHVVYTAPIPRVEHFYLQDIVQQHFDEEVGIDEQSHSPSVLQRAMQCCNSTDV
jgi:hypothetical protein